MTYKGHIHIRATDLGIFRYRDTRVVRRPTATLGPRPRDTGETLRCHTCQAAINPRTDIRFDMDNRVFCSGACIFKYRGNRRLW